MEIFLPSLVSTAFVAALYLLALWIAMLFLRKYLGISAIEERLTKIHLEQVRMAGKLEALLEIHKSLDRPVV